MTTGDYSEDLHELAQSGTGGFLLICVVAAFGAWDRAALGAGGRRGCRRQTLPEARQPGRLAVVELFERFGVLARGRCES